MAFEAETWPEAEQQIRRGKHMRVDTVGGLQIDCIAWAAIVTLLTGCASPYVVSDRSLGGQQLKPQVLGEAIAQARSRSLDYRDKVVELGESERLLSNGLLTLGAVILGASVAKVHSSAITGAGLIAGSAYTVGTFNTDKRRGAIYLAGIKAIDCSIAAVVPLAMSGHALNVLEAQQLAMDDQVPKVAEASGGVDQWLVQAKASGNSLFFQAAIDSAQAGLTAAAAAVTKANSASAAAANRRLRAEEMGNLLVGTIKDIDAAVLLEIRGTEGSIQAVPGLVASIQTNASLFAPTTTGSTEAAPHGGGQTNTVSPPKPEAPNADDLRVMSHLGTKIGALRQATIDLDSRAERLVSLATPINSQSAEALKLCKVETTIKPMTVTPAAVSFTAKKAGTQTVLIDGGSGNYTGVFLNGPVPGLKSVARPLSTGAIDIVADDKTVPGGYQLMIEDSTRRSRQIVAVTVAAAAAAAADEVPDKVKKAIAAITAAGSVKVKGIKVTLLNPRPLGQNGVVVDYRAEGGDAVANEDVAIEVGNLQGVGIVLGERAVQAVNADPQPAAGLQLRANAPLTLEQVRKLQTALCLPDDQRDGLWGPQTQAALNRDRARRRAEGVPSVSADKADLTAAEKKLLLSLSPDAAAGRCKPR